MFEPTNIKTARLSVVIWLSVALLATGCGRRAGQLAVEVGVQVGAAVVVGMAAHMLERAATADERAQAREAEYQEELARACRAGRPAACVAVGDLEAACLAGRVDLCVPVGRNQERFGYLSAAQASFRMACRAEQEVGCSLLLDLYASGNVSPDPRLEPAVELIETCRKEARWEICEEMLADVDALDAYCDEGSAEACYLSSVSLSEGHGEIDDPQRSVSAARQACVAGLREGCEQACDGDELGSCVVLGARYLSGDTEEVDIGKARKLFGKACDGGDARGCLNLGLVWQEGYDVPPDIHHAEESYAKACWLGSALGCYRAGELRVADGRSVAAAKPFRAGCELGMKKACSALRALAPADREAALGAEGP